MKMNDENAGIEAYLVTFLRLEEAMNGFGHNSNHKVVSVEDFVALPPTGFVEALCRNVGLHGL